MIILLKQLSSDGHTIVLITHDPEVAQHAHRRIDISDGRIISDPGPNPGASENAKPLEHTGALHGEPPFRNEVIEGTKTAFRSPSSNIFRTVLTLLGIVIGVASVIADRKSTRLNSSHVARSYAVFC